MPLPLVPIAIGAVALSAGAAVHATLKRRKWQKVHDEALAKAQRTGSQTRSRLKEFNDVAEELGKLRVQELETLKRAANFLKRARVKHREFRPEFAEIRPAELEHWRKLHSQAVKTLGIGAAGTVGVAGAGVAAATGLYTAAGILGTTSTGTAISGLSGAAAHSARMAWLGGGALSTGGAGMAGGAATLMVAANVVMTPVALAAAVWSERQAGKFQKEVERKLEEFARIETGMRRRQTILAAGLRRMKEIRTAIMRTSAVLERSLKDADPKDPETSYGVYLNAKALSESLGAEGLSQQQMLELRS